MAYFPNGNRPYPAYSAGYPSAPQATPWPAMPPAANNAFRQPIQNPQQPARFPVATGYPATAAPTANHWYSATAAQSPQNMTISLNAPKLSTAELKKSFWLKVAAGTISIVAGLGIAAFFGMKILPKKIAQEMGGEFKEAMLSPEARANLLKEMSNTVEGKKALNGRSLADLSQKEKDKLITEYNKKLPLSRVIGICTREGIDYTFTPEYSQKLREKHINPIVDASVARFDNQVLNNDKYMEDASKRVRAYMEPQVSGMVDNLLKKIKKNSTFARFFL